MFVDAVIGTRDEGVEVGGNGIAIKVATTALGSHSKSFQDEWLEWCWKMSKNRVHNVVGSHEGTLVVSLGMVSPKEIDMLLLGETVWNRVLYLCVTATVDMSTFNRNDVFFSKDDLLFLRVTSSFFNGTFVPVRHGREVSKHLKVKVMGRLEAFLLSLYMTTIVGIIVNKREGQGFAYRLVGHCVEQGQVPHKIDRARGTNVLGVCILGKGLEDEKFTILVYKLLDVVFIVAV